MNKYILILFLLFSPLCGFCQLFGVTGATWHYETIEAPMSGPQAGYLKVESYKDTVISNKICHVLKNTCFNSDGSVTASKSTYLYQSNLKIYQFIYNKFFVLYDFGVKKGDTISVPKQFLQNNKEDTTFKCIVDSTGSKVIGGKTLKFYHLRRLNYIWVFDSPIIESLGAGQSMLPQPIGLADVWFISKLRCYADQDFSFSSGVPCTKLIPENEWAPLGAKWYYNEPGSDTMTGNESPFISLQSKKDTVIKGRNCHAIDVKFNDTKNISQEYISQSKDSVFYFNPFYNAFFLLYNFSAKAGDTIVVHKNKFKPTKGFYAKNDSIANFKYRIIAVDTLIMGRNIIIRQKVNTVHNGDWGFITAHPSTDQYIYRQAGSLTYFFGSSANIYPEQIPTILRCYSDINLTYKSPEWNLPCNYITGIEELENPDLIKIYPNPVVHSIVLETNEAMSEVRIISAVCNTVSVSKYHPDSNKAEIDLSTFSSGLYVVQIITKSRTINYKVVKN
jgi:hypothetical protein